ncbi:MAG: hypothetical protein VYC39_15075 [Myxococcota bacterium]|nr:hypothetical protein [Myxococcota bacterium]
MKVKVKLIAIFALSILAGCSPKTVKPEDSLTEFLTAVRSKRSDAVWELLSSASRSRITKKAKEIQVVTKKETPIDRRTLLFEHYNLMTIRAPESISVTSPLTSTAKLRVTLKNGKTTNFTMIREGTGWKVDLFQSLTKTSSVSVLTRP